MAGWIAKRITQILVASAVVKEDDTELYIYGFFMLVSRILFLSYFISLCDCGDGLSDRNFA